jgi:hypothetical protein
MVFLYKAHLKILQGLVYKPLGGRGIGGIYIQSLSS